MAAGGAAGTVADGATGARGGALTGVGTESEFGGRTALPRTAELSITPGSTTGRADESRRSPSTTSAATSTVAPPEIAATFVQFVRRGFVIFATESRTHVWIAVLF
jgi:hypothetical protein